MFIFIGLEAINIVYMERKFKSNLQMSFTEQQIWVTFYCTILTFLFWIVDDHSTWFGSGKYDSVFHGFSLKTYFLLLWRTLHAVIIFWMVRYLTSVVAMLVHTTASLGTSVLDWLFMANMLETGQWFDAIATAALALIYKISPYQPHQNRRFEILQVDDDDDILM